MSDPFGLDSPVPGTLPHGIYITATADISACGRYRYALTRIWNPALPVLVVVALNPSTADGERDDPTVRKCCGFAARWGYGGLVIVNLYAYRATDPRELLEVDDPVGPRNDAAIAYYAKNHDILFAWGALNRRLSARARVVEKRLLPLRRSTTCLGRTKDGEPRHPLMLAYTTAREAYSFASAPECQDLLTPHADAC